MHILISICIFAFGIIYNAAHIHLYTNYLIWMNYRMMYTVAAQALSNARLEFCIRREDVRNKYSLTSFFSEEIKDLFPRFGYQVRSFTNTSSKEILRLVDLYSKKKDSGSLICFLSSHGNQTSLGCTDGSTVKIIDILGKANTDELKNRPKVFFIDACREYICVNIAGTTYR